MDGGAAIRGRDCLRLGALSACLLATLALYVVVAVILGSPPPGWDGLVRFSLPSAAMFRAFTGLPLLALSPAGFSRALGAAFVLLWLLLGAAVLSLRGITGADARRWARFIVIGGGAAILALVVVSVPPLLSADMYRQAIYGHMVGEGVNPYGTAAAAVADPLQALANQTRTTTIYGPAFTLLSAVAAGLAPSSALGVALAWKTMAALAALGTVFLAEPVARALADGGPAGGGDNRGEGRGDEARLWLAWNPLIVVEAAGAGHVESLMMLPALAGLLMLARRRPLSGCAWLVVSTLMKWVTGVLLVLAVLREVRCAERGERLRASMRLVGVAGLVTALLYAPFARGLMTATGIHGLAMHGGAGIGAVSGDWAPAWAMTAGFAALVAASAPFATGGGWPRLVAAATGLVLVFVLLVPPWFFPWYMVAPVVLAAVLPAGRGGLVLRLMALGIGGSAMLYYAKLVPVP